MVMNYYKLLLASCIIVSCFILLIMDNKIDTKFRSRISWALFYIGLGIVNLILR